MKIFVICVAVIRYIGTAPVNIYFPFVTAMIKRFPRFLFREDTIISLATNFTGFSLIKEFQVQFVLPSLAAMRTISSQSYRHIDISVLCGGRSSPDAQCQILAFSGCPAKTRKWAIMTTPSAKLQDLSLKWSICQTFLYKYSVLINGKSEYGSELWTTKYCRRALFSCSIYTSFKFQVVNFSFLKLMFQFYVHQEPLRFFSFDVIVRAHSDYYYGNHYIWRDH